jgi:hypothetical protein
MKKEYNSKYNFNINELEQASHNNLVKKYSLRRKYNLAIKTLESDSFYIIKNLKLDKIEAEKVKVDSKTYHENLKSKIILNFRLFQIFFNNFYRDDFTNSRQGTYIIFTLPFITGGVYYLLSPRHPMRVLAFNVSIISSFIFFYFCLKKDFEDLAYSGTPLGNEVKNLKNNIAMISILSPAYEEKKDE